MAEIFDLEFLKYIGALIAILVPLRKWMKENKEASEKNTDASIKSAEASAELKATIKGLAGKQEETAQDLCRLQEANREAHRRLWEHNDEQDDKIAGHTTAIQLIKQAIDMEEGK